jgi:hypothetical protein
MDERKLKRLAVILLVAIIAIIIAKYLLTRAVTNVGNAALEKKRATAVQQAPEPASEPLATEPAPEPVPASAVEAVSEVASAVPATDSTSQ